MPTLQLDVEETRVLDSVIDATKSLSWGDFIRLVCSTYPIVSQERYQVLNLPDLATNYRQQIEDVQMA
jgi:hypothetical protein